MEERDLIFGPDQNLGAYVAKQCPEKNIVLWDGYCPTHHRIQKEDVLAAKAAHPGAPVLVHPECPPDVTALADYVGSTKGIIDYAAASDCRELIIGTEMGVLYQLEKNNPGKTFYLMTPGLICPNMKKTSLKSVLSSLETGETEIRVPEETAARARKALERMMRLGS